MASLECGQRMEQGSGLVSLSHDLGEAPPLAAEFLRAACSYFHLCFWLTESRRPLLVNFWAFIIFEFVKIFIYLSNYYSLLGSLFPHFCYPCKYYWGPCCLRALTALCLPGHLLSVYTLLRGGSSTLSPGFVDLPTSSSQAPFISAAGVYYFPVLMILRVLTSP